MNPDPSKTSHRPLPRHAAACGLALFLLLTPTAHAAPWKRHAIDNTSRGADGVRLMDVNGDGRLDITTGWEEGGVIRVYLHPGPNHVKEQWPAVTVGRVKSPEDAVFVDLDGDGAVDVVSSCEGNTRTMFVHWAPTDKSKYLDESAWKTEPIPATQGKQMWMFCLPKQVDGKYGIDLIVGSKGGGAAIGWLQAPRDARDLEKWKYHKLRDAGWIMSLIAYDMDGDGEEDVLYSDRKGAHRGVGWLAYPGAARAGSLRPWTDHVIGATDREVMFIDGPHVSQEPAGMRIFAPVKPNEVLELARVGKADAPWTTITYKHPANTGRTKAARAVDIDMDGALDLVVTCEGAEGNLSGVKWFTMNDASQAGAVEGHDISGPEGVKYDLIEMIDLDGDGDLDLLTCEERTNLGVIWYENPTR